MEPNEISERNRRQLDKLPLDKRAKAEAALARTKTPEFRAQMSAERERLDRQFRETGHVATAGQAISPEDLDRLKAFPMTLRREREARGLSLADVADLSGIDKAALSRLENGQQPNPTLSTLARYARALGKRLALTLE